ncbi:translation initiation factor IF-1 [Candidatus Gracilibacteria bacterium CG17_big_fil_post_rev_8_21_14_2_50_48_13]|nr:MAG: translation initiation factor IF-1 [Candidatus Gracilibacteria bacterium CG17_big_fil_post_rev_8_21_14_2_50_48_13]
MSKKEDIVVVEGEVLEVLPGMKCKVRILGITEGPERIILAYLSGKMKKHFIKIIPGDKVRVEISVYDLQKGRITFRETNLANTYIK